jgi:hypothetical protein
MNIEERLAYFVRKIKNHDLSVHVARIDYTNPEILLTIEYRVSGNDNIQVLAACDGIPGFSIIEKPPGTDFSDDHVLYDGEYDGEISSYLWDGNESDLG